MEPDFFFCGLEFGAPGSPSSLAVVERTLRQAPDRWDKLYSFRSFSAWPGYAAAAAALAEEGRAVRPRQVAAVADIAGPGAAVVPLLRGAGFPGDVVPVLVTGAAKSVWSPDAFWRVARADLSRVVAAVLGEGRLTARGLPLAGGVGAALADLNNAGGEWGGIARAAALALWYSETGGLRFQTDEEEAEDLRRLGRDLGW